MWIMWISGNSNKDFVQVVRLTIKLFLCHLQILPFSVMKKIRYVNGNVKINFL